MARISKSIQFKPAVDRLFQAGKIPSDVFSLFPDIAASTIRDWLDRGISEGLWQQPSTIHSFQTQNTPDSTPHATQSALPFVAY